MKDCLDQGILQSYFDGELPSESRKSVNSHLLTCPTCAAAAQELERENLMLATALAPEFDSSVPTERLRRRIDSAIAEIPLATPIREVSVDEPKVSWLQSLASLFAFTPQRALAYAGLIVMVTFAGLITLIQFRSTTTDPRENVAVNNTSNIPSEQPVAKPNASDEEREISAAPTAVSSSLKKPVRPSRRIKPGNSTVVEVKLLPGERTYLETIAELDYAINSSPEMRPALQAEYERNLALVDRALAATRNVAKNNPNDPDAVDFMFAAYQSKVDLLNTVADARTFNRR